MSETKEVPIDHTVCEGGQPVVAFKLSPYEFANLLAALETVAGDVGTPQECQSPLQAIHTGDWTMCLVYRLRETKKKLGIDYPPNATPAEMRKQSWNLARYFSNDSSKPR